MRSRTSCFHLVQRLRQGGGKEIKIAPGGLKIGDGGVQLAEVNPLIAEAPVEAGQAGVERRQALLQRRDRAGFLFQYNQAPAQRVYTGIHGLQVCGDVGQTGLEGVHL